MSGTFGESRWQAYGYNTRRCIKFSWWVNEAMRGVGVLGDRLFANLDSAMLRFHATLYSVYMFKDIY